jgi:hypothetical protein
MNATNRVHEIADTLRKIGITLLFGPDQDSSGVVAETAMTIEDAKRAVAILTAEGLEASWAPDAADQSVAWLYVSQDDIDD